MALTLALYFFLTDGKTALFHQRREYFVEER